MDEKDRSTPETGDTYIETEDSDSTAAQDVKEAEPVTETPEGAENSDSTETRETEDPENLTEPVETTADTSASDKNPEDITEPVETTVDTAASDKDPEDITEPVETTADTTASDKNAESIASIEAAASAEPIEHKENGNTERVQSAEIISGGDNAKPPETAESTELTGPTEHPEPTESTTEKEEPGEDADGMPQPGGDANPDESPKSAKPRRGPVRRALHIAGTVVFVLFILFLAFVVVVTLSSKKAGGSSFFGYSLYTVQSGSMAPNIPEGSTVFDTVKGAAEIQERDVITYRDSTGKHITHRVIKVVYSEEIDTYLYITRGDVNPQDDPEMVPYESVAGVVIFYIPYLGWLIDFLRPPNPGLFIVIALGVLIFVVELIRMIRFSKESKTREP